MASTAFAGGGTDGTKPGSGAATVVVPTGPPATEKDRPGSERVPASGRGDGDWDNLFPTDTPVVKEDPKKTGGGEEPADETVTNTTRQGDNDERLDSSRTAEPVAPPIAKGRPTATDPRRDPADEDPKLVEQKRALVRLIENAPPEQAQQAVAAARKLYPHDQDLAALELLIGPKTRPDVDSKGMRREAQGLLPASAGSEPALASAVSWPGAGGAARAAAPGAARSGGSGSEMLFRRDLAREGLLKMNLGDFKDADRLLTLRILDDPKDWLALRLRALTRRKLGRSQAALSDAERAVALNGDDAWSHKIRALVLADLKRDREAVAGATRALELRPDDPDTLALRAEAYDRLGLGDEALSDLQRAAALDPQFERLYRAALGSRGRAPRGAWGLVSPRAAALGGLSLALLLLAAVLLRGKALTTARKLALRRSDRPAVTLPIGYSLVRKIGEGGMGVVFEALDEGLQRRVALKRMREELAADPREMRRFLKEARTVAALRHPNIVEIHSIIEQSGSLFLVFELIPGEGLDRAGRMAPPHALRVVGQVADALDYAHGQGIVHQDLKPSNIMLAGPQAKVMDFGIARRLRETLSTRSGSEIVGTPAYMAPEQESGLCGPTGDLYSLGVCAYELLSGRRPFDAAATAFVKLERRYQPLSEAARLPPAVDAAIDRALDPHPSQRQASARAFADELTRALS